MNSSAIRLKRAYFSTQTCFPSLRAAKSDRLSSNKFQCIDLYSIYFAQVKGNGLIDIETADHALHRLEVDNRGFDFCHRNSLLVIVLLQLAFGSSIKKPAGKRVGIRDLD